MSARREPPVAYELVDHTADIGVVVTGIDLADLLAAAGVALADLITDPAQVEARNTRTISLEAPSAEELLVRWLNELIFVREVEEFLWRTVEVQVEGETRLRATLHGETYRPGKHAVRTGLKAATYHQLAITRAPGAWKARVILDV